MTELSRRQHLKQLGAMAGTRRHVRSVRARIRRRSRNSPEGIGKGIKHISYSDQGGRPDGVQVMVNRKHVYVGHMFSDGVTILDATDPRKLKPVGFFTAGQYTRTHHLRVSDDLLLLANGANIVAMQSYDGMRGYFENNLVDSITNRKKFRSGLSIHDISKPGEMREIAFLEMPGFGINRVWWPGGRYATVAAHFDGYTDHILCIVDLKDITKPEIVSKWWLPGMNRAAGETPTLPKGKRAALHHMITAGNLGYGAWRDGGFTILDISDPAKPKLLSHINWSPPFPGGTHTPLPLPKRGIGCRGRTKPMPKNAPRASSTPSLSMCVRPRTRCRFPPCPRRGTAISAPSAPSGPHNLHKTGPVRCKAKTWCSPPTTTPACACSTSRMPLRPREGLPISAAHAQETGGSQAQHFLAAKTCDAYVTPEGLMFVSDWNAGMHVLQYEVKPVLEPHPCRWRLRVRDDGKARHPAAFLSGTEPSTRAIWGRFDADARNT